ASIIEAFVVHGIPHRPLVAVVALGWTVPFAFRARWPLGAPLAVAASLAALALLAGEATDNLVMPFVAALTVAVSFGVLRDRRQAVAGWSAIIGAAAVVDYQSANT